jgi:hypothetical protein
MTTARFAVDRARVALGSGLAGGERASGEARDPVRRHVLV